MVYTKMYHHIVYTISYYIVIYTTMYHYIVYTIIMSEAEGTLVQLSNEEHGNYRDYRGYRVI